MPHENGPDRAGNADEAEVVAGSRTDTNRTGPPRHDPAVDAAEAAVLGSAILSREARDGLMKMLSPRDFGRDAHRVLFDVIGQLHTAGAAVDLVTVTVALADRDLLDEVGGAGALSLLTSLETCPAPAAWPAYATPVAREARRRRLRAVLAGAVVRLDRGDDPNVVAAETISAWEAVA
jgi:replicative DNA helicase